MVFLALNAWMNLRVIWHLAAYIMTCYQPSSAKKKIIISKKKYMIDFLKECNNSCVCSKERKKNYKAETSPVKKNIFLQKLATRLPISEHSCQPPIPCWNIIWRKKVKVIHEMFHCPPPHKLMQPLFLLLSLSWGYFLTYFLSREVRRQIACWDKMLECHFFSIPP